MGISPSMGRTVRGVREEIKRIKIVIINKNSSCLPTSRIVLPIEGEMPAGQRGS